jgi:hypothetical protein
MSGPHWSPPRSFIVLEHSNDYAGCNRGTKFKPLALGEIQAADDTQALGLLWDYCIANDKRNRGLDQCEIFRGFATALLNGTIKTDGTDDTGLFWPTGPYARCRDLIKAIETFAQWCEWESGRKSGITPRDIPLLPGTGEYVAAMLRWGNISEASMLKHIKHRNQEAPKTKKKSVIDIGRNPRGHSVEPVKFFPPEHAPRLLWEGYRIPGMQGEPNIFLRYNVRNMMIALLDGWGGLRRSEGFHFWIQDVIEDPNNLEQALVVLNHPAEAKVEVVNPATGAIETLTRKEALIRDYGLIARNDITRGGRRSGWKGMDLNDDCQACVFWIDPDAGKLFWVLYWGYLSHIRTPIMERRRKLGGRDHPFLFVSERVDENPGARGLPGEPYSIKAYERSHAAAVKRIGLVHRKHAGTTTHGLRHLYGQTLAKLKVDAMVIKKGLHHRNLLSQAPYTVPTNADINASLRSAQLNIAAGTIRAIAPIAETTAAALLKISEFRTQGGF